jgi:hypothetical protein
VDEVVFIDEHCYILIIMVEKEQEQGGLSSELEGFMVVDGRHVQVQLGDETWTVVNFTGASGWEQRFEELKEQATLYEPS